MSQVKDISVEAYRQAKASMESEIADAIRTATTKFVEATGVIVTGINVTTLQHTSYSAGARFGRVIDATLHSVKTETNL